MRIKKIKGTAETKTVEKKCVAKRRYTRKAAAPKAALTKVTFTVHAEKGKTIYVAGEFNDWDPTAKKMAYKARSGVYAATMKLAAGSYQYKFVIDGVWCADPENANAVPNDQGTFNSVIDVK